MGICGSKEAGATGAVEGEQEVQNARSVAAGSIQPEKMKQDYPDFTTRPDHQGQPQGSSDPGKYILKVQLDDSPSYEAHTSVDALKNITREANDFSMHGIKSTFDVLGQRHFEIFIDTTYTLPPDTWKSILLVALYVLGNAKAKDSHMTFYFTSYPNTSSESLTQQKRNYIKALVKLWRTQSWPAAVEAVRNDPLLANNLGFDNFTEKANFDTGESDEEKHLKLLNFTRESMIPYWYGWHQRDLTMEKLRGLFANAIRASRKQPKSLNSVRITYERSIKHYLRNFEKLKKDPTKEVAPTTVIMLVGSPLQPSELEAIKLCQGEGKTLVAEMKQYKGRQWLGRQQISAITRRDTSKRDAIKHDPSGQEPSMVNGTGTQFQIFTMLFTGHLDTQTIRRFQEIDDFAEGDDDINDLLLVKEAMILLHFLSAMALFKMFNAHHPQVDGMHLVNPENIYSKYNLFTAGPEGSSRTIIPPTVVQFRKIHGIEDISELQGFEDSDDENDGTPQVRRATRPAKVVVQAAPEYTSSATADDNTARALLPTHNANVKREPVDPWDSNDE